MSRELLDMKEIINGVLDHNPDRDVSAKLLSRHWTVVQVPSSTTPNYLYYVVGSQREGFRCSCIGFQAHGRCKHVLAVVETFKAVKAKRGQKTKRRSKRHFFVPDRPPERRCFECRKLRTDSIHVGFMKARQQGGKR